MFDSWKYLRLGTLVMSALLMIAAASFGQSGTGGVRGQVTDPSGAAVPAISVTAVGPNGAAREVQTNEEGRYVFQNLAPGTYTLRIQVKGFADFNQADVVVTPGQVRVVDAQLVVALEKQQVTVTDSAAQVSVSSENNASALVLKGKDLDALSDDPDELQSQLQALAGPAAGPNGGEIYIDGFTGGQLPLKSAIREIRVNQNPFSAQYDKLGYGRIEILTKPGQDKFSLFGFYSLSFANSNTAGIGSFPSDQYDIALDYGRAAYDVRHRLFLGGSFSLPKGFRLSPFMMTSSGAPFNITVGQDLNGDSIFNDRPAFAAAGATGSNIIATKWGTFDTDPKSGEKIIPINYGTGPGFFELNLRLSKTFAFGRRAERSTSAGGMQGPPPGGGRGGPPPGGGGLGPGGLGGSGGGPGGPGGPFGSAAANTRYNLTFSVGSRNVFNLVNLGTPVGQLTSPLFGQSNSLAGFFANGGSRHIDFQVMFSF